MVPNGAAGEVLEVLEEGQLCQTIAIGLGAGFVAYSFGRKIE